MWVLSTREHANAQKREWLAIENLLLFCLFHSSISSKLMACTPLDGGGENFFKKIFVNNRYLTYRGLEAALSSPGRCAVFGYKTTFLLIDSSFQFFLIPSLSLMTRINDNYPERGRSQMTLLERERETLPIKLP